MGRGERPTCGEPAARHSSCDVGKEAGLSAGTGAKPERTKITETRITGPQMASCHSEATMRALRGLDCMQWLSESVALIALTLTDISGAAHR
jgi:hypothetical protein